MGLRETLVQWGAPLLSLVCLPSVKQDIQNCQILAVFTSPMAAWKAWLFFFSKRFSKTISSLFSFLLKKILGSQNLAVSGYNPHQPTFCG